MKSNSKRNNKVVSKFISTHLQIKSKPIHSQLNQNLLKKDQSIKNKLKDNNSREKISRTKIGNRSKIISHNKKQALENKRSIFAPAKVTRQKNRGAASIRSNRVNSIVILHGKLKPKGNKKLLKKSEKTKILKKSLKR